MGTKAVKRAATDSLTNAEKRNTALKYPRCLIRFAGSVHGPEQVSIDLRKREKEGPGKGPQKERRTSPSPLKLATVDSNVGSGKPQYGSANAEKRKTDLGYPMSHPFAGPVHGLRDDSGHAARGCCCLCKASCREVSLIFF